MSLFARYTGARIHIFHLSSKDGAMMVREWKDKGVDITAETGPHYLFLPAEKYMNRLGSRLRMNPPVRTSEHGEYLYRSILDGTVETITTDHSPHTPEEKLNPDIWKAVSGFTGVETVIPIMLSEAVHKRGMSLNQFVKICSENPAKVWGIWPRKGSLNVGADADLTIIDLAREWTIDEAKLHSKNNVTPWHGWSGRGKPVTTVVRGHVMVRDEKFVAERPAGRLIRPLARS
jgi:dihydroorotase